MNSQSREVWLRRIDAKAGTENQAWQCFPLAELGHAAARETLVASTPHMASIWTDLFRSLLAPSNSSAPQHRWPMPKCPELRWTSSGPGVGRDAKIAYSSLLGRFVARMYLTCDEKIRVLVPLDLAKQRLKGTNYKIRKDPPGRGLEADWIGLDDSGLVIAEAKGSYDQGFKTWRGPQSRPYPLNTAINQAERTAVFNSKSLFQLPARRWAIASRWKTQGEHVRDPSVIAWKKDDGSLCGSDYKALLALLLQADLDAILNELGHPGAVGTTETLGHAGRLPGDLLLRVGDRRLDPGFGAAIGPLGIRPLREPADLELAQQLRSAGLPIAVALLASRYALSVRTGDVWREPESLDDLPISILHRSGLEVLWLNADEEIRLVDE